MKFSAFVFKALGSLLLSVATFSNAGESPPPDAATDPKVAEGPTTELESRVNTLESKIAELDRVVKALDNRVLELESALLKRRLDAPDKLHFYRECDNLLDRLQSELSPYEYASLPGVESKTSTAMLISIPFDPVEPEPTPPPLPGPKPVKIVLPLPENKVELQVLYNAVDNLRDNATSKVSAQSAAALRQAGEHGLAVLVAHGLYHDVPAVRTRSAEMLGTLGGMHVIRELIEAFYSAGEATVPPYQREYVKMLRDQISNVTGNDFYFYIRRTSRAPEVAAEMVAWWDQHWQSAPPQIGEPKLDLTSPYYLEELRSLRSLKLVKRTFGSANYPADLGVPPGEVTRDADQPFKKTIPSVSRESINSNAQPEGRYDAKTLRDENARQRNKVP